MEFSTLNASVNISVDIDTEAVVNAIATNAAMLAYKVVKFTLDRAVDDTRKLYGEVSKAASVVTDKAKRDINTVISAGRFSGVIVEDKLNTSYSTAKATVIDAIAASQETRDAVVAATKVKAAKAFDTQVVKPSEDIKAQVTAPIKSTVALLEKAIADYTRIDEVQAIAEEVPSAIESQNEINAALREEKPQVIDGAIVSSAGVTNTIAVTEAVEEVQPKTSGLSKLIREEVAKR